jgi:hypothetical protein
VKKPKSPEIKVPQLFRDVYADLRDRRLLIPVAALLVALIGVPVFLASDPQPTPAPPVAVADDEASEVSAAVLVEQSGIRNYRKRLAQLKEQDPFDQKFALPSPGDVAIDEENAEAAGIDTGADAADTSAPVSSSSTPSTDEITDSISESVTQASPPVDSTVQETTTVTETKPVEPPKPQVRFFDDRVDVALGPLGHVRKYDDVRSLDFLPEDKTPVITFVGLAGNGESAVFSISSDVFETSGEGSCAPKKPAACQYLTLKEGEERRLKYEPNGKTYRLKLRETHIVRVPDPRGD